MKIVNNSDEYHMYTPEEHIENLKRLAELTKQATDLGTGTGGVDQMITVAIKAASDAGLATEDIATYSRKSVEDIEHLTA